MNYGSMKLTTLHANSVVRRWGMPALFCLSLVLAQLLVVSHFHGENSDHGLANHDCATCIVAELLDSSASDAAKSILPNARNVFITWHIVSPSIDLTRSLYQVRAPPFAIPV